jgi:hypothetical protein
MAAEQVIGLSCQAQPGCVGRVRIGFVLPPSNLISPESLLQFSSLPSRTEYSPERSRGAGDEQ